MTAPAALLSVRWAGRPDLPDFYVQPDTVRYGPRTSNGTLKAALAVHADEAKEGHKPYFPQPDGWLCEVVILEVLAPLRLTEVHAVEPRSPRGRRGHVLGAVLDLDPEASEVLDAPLRIRRLSDPGVPVDPVRPKNLEPASEIEVGRLRKAFGAVLGEKGGAS